MNLRNPVNALEQSIVEKPGSKGAEVNTLIDLLQYQVSAQPNAQAIVGMHGSMTFKQLEQQAEKA